MRCTWVRTPQLRSWVVKGSVYSYTFCAQLSVTNNQYPRGICDPTHKYMSQSLQYFQSVLANLQICMLSTRCPIDCDLRCTCGVQKVQDKMIAEVQEWCRGCRGGAGAVQVVQGRCRWCRLGAGYLNRLHVHLSKHNNYNIRCREVQGVQAQLRLRLHYTCITLIKKSGLWHKCVPFN